MQIARYKTSLLVITTTVSLLIASPALQQLLTFPQSESLSEFWLFGPSHNTSYPSNVTAGKTYRLYLDISNHLGSCSYYVIEVKFRNLSQSAPNSFNHTRSTLPALGRISFFVANNISFELPIDISFNYKMDDKVADRIDMQNIVVNNIILSVNSTTIALDKVKNGYYGNLFFELWNYNTTTGRLQYHERYVSLWLKMGA